MWTVEKIAPIALPLVNKFYKGNRSRAKAKSSDKVWIVRKDDSNGAEIIAALRVVQLCGHEFLTGVHVAEEYQGQGVATSMLQQVFTRIYQQGLVRANKPCYTFPYRHLIDFYQGLGWQVIDITQAPANFQTRYERYCKQGRDIGVMIYHPPECEMSA